MRKKLLSFLLAIFCLAGILPAENLKLPPLAYYGIYWDNTLVGYSSYQVEKRITLLSQRYLKLNSESHLKINAPVRFIAQTILEESTLNPLSFICSQQTGSPEKTVQKLGLECLFSEKLIAQKILLGEKVSNSFTDFSPPVSLYLANLWGKFDTLAEHFQILGAKTGKAAKTFTVYDPIFKNLEEVSVTYKGKASLKLNPAGGKALEYPCDLYQFSGPFAGCIFQAFFEQKSGKLLKLQQLDGQLSLLWAGEEIAKEYQKAKVIDFWAKRVVPSKLYFPYPEKIDFLKAELEITSSSGELLNHQVAGFNQKFSGENSGGKIKGEIEITTQPVEIKQGDPFPLPVENPYPEEVLAYLKPETGIESSLLVIKNKARELTWGKTESLEISKEILNWVFNNIKTGESLPSALLTLEDGVGSSEGKAQLFIALLRAIGIPARKISGLIFSGGYFLPHYWAEVYFKSSGWLAFDPGISEFLKLSALHIAVTANGELGEIKTVQVKEFKPRLSATASYFPRELRWPVGEERTYQLKKGDELLGELKARLSDISIWEGEETYDFKEELSLKLQNLKSQIKYNLYGVPLLYTLGNEQYRFNESEINITRANGQWIMPYPYGSYLADSRLYSQWFLFLEQMPVKDEGSSFGLQIFNPEKLSLEKLDFKVGKSLERDAGIEGIKDLIKIKVIPVTCSDGKEFYLDQSGKVIEMLDKKNNLKIELKNARFKLGEN